MWNLIDGCLNPDSNLVISDVGSGVIREVLNTRGLASCAPSDNMDSDRQLTRQEGTPRLVQPRTRGLLRVGVRAATVSLRALMGSWVALPRAAETPCCTCHATDAKQVEYVDPCTDTDPLSCRCRIHVTLPRVFWSTLTRRIRGQCCTI